MYDRKYSKEKGHFLLAEVAKKVIEVYSDTLFLIVASGASNSYKNSWKGKIKSLFNYPLDNFQRMKILLSKRFEKQIYIYWI